MRALRLLLPGLLACLLFLAAGAHAASGRCSASGDSCYSAGKRMGKVKLAFSTFSYRGRIEVCVTGPRGAAQECKSFRLRRPVRGVRSVDATWSAHFSRRGGGTYRVRYRVPGATAPFPSVSFRLKR